MKDNLYQIDPTELRIHAENQRGYDELTCRMSVYKKKLKQRSKVQRGLRRKVGYVNDAI